MPDPTPAADPTPTPNAVLRDGPFDGERVRASPPLPVVRHAGKVRHVYWPTAESDPEHPGLSVYRHRERLVY